MARQVVTDDQVIDELEALVDDTVAKLIATRQPVARDLRRLIAAMKIAADMERMADLAVNIAKVTIELNDNRLCLFKEWTDILKMAEHTKRMVQSGIGCKNGFGSAARLPGSGTADGRNRFFCITKSIEHSKN